MKPMIDLKTIIDNLPLAIFAVDSERRVLLFNQMAKKIYGVDRNGNQPKRLGDIIDCTNASASVAGCGRSENCHLCQIKAQIDRAFAEKSSSDPLDTEIHIRSAGVRSLRITVAHIYSKTTPTSEGESCVVTVEDMTEIKKKEKLAAAVETIGAVCHELSQPLQAIMGGVTLLTMHQLEGSAIARLEKINSEIERIKNIKNKLMNITQYQTKSYLSATILDVEGSIG